MAYPFGNKLYGLARQAFLEGTLCWLDPTNIKAVLCDATYVPSMDTDQFLAIITAGKRVATSGNLASKSSTLGVANAGNVTFSAVSGSAIYSIVLYKDTGDEATSPLIAYIDTATGLPVTPSGGDIIVQWDTGANKIFKL
jgi:hypothetical protein